MNKGSVKMKSSGDLEMDIVSLLGQGLATSLFEIIYLKTSDC